MIEKDIRDAGLLVETARTGIVEVWTIVVTALRGQDLLQEVLNSAAGSLW